MRKTKSVLRLFASLLMIGHLASSSVAQARGIEVEERVAERLNGVLEGAVLLHQSLHAGDEMALSDSIDRLLERLREARASASAMAPHDRQHLEFIINAIRAQVERVPYASGRERRDHVKEAFYQIAHMTRIYKLDSKYQVFFCAQDRSHWVQARRTLAKNPVNPDTLGQCGKIVR